MRLHPAVTEEEALAWLLAQAEARWGTVSPELLAGLKSLAKAMADVSAVQIPEHIEP
jgi:hypothetical protein